MRTSSLSTLALLSALTLAIAACGGADDEPNGDSSNNNGSTTTAESSEYVESLPTAEMVSIDEADSEGLSLRQNLAPEDALEAQTESVSGRLRDHIANVRSSTQALIDKTHAQIDTIIANGEVVATTVNGEECRVWTYDGAKLAWRLGICRKTGAVDGLSGQAYGWMLQGRALDAAEDAAYDRIAAGESLKLTREDGKRGGAGRAFYDFDNLAKYTGEDYSGKLGIGYRAAGRARQVWLGLKELDGPGAAGPRTALYRYAHVIGKGGRLQLLTRHDLLARDASDMLVEGKDDVEELSRAAVVWSAQGRTRVNVYACNGTVGQGECVHMRQCWETEQTQVTFSRITNALSEQTWEMTSCGSPFFSADEAPAEADVSFAGDAAAMPIPGETVEGM